MRFDSSVSTKLFGALAISAAALLSGCDAASATAPDPTTGILTISSPKAGSTLHIGDSLVVKWSVKDDPNNVIDAVGVSLSADDGKTWGALHSNSIAPADPRWGRFAWKIQDSLLIQTLNKSVPLAGVKTCRVKVGQYTPANPALMVLSTEAFTIAP